MSGSVDLRLAVVVDSDAFGGAEVYARNLLRWLPRRWRRCLVVAEPVAEHFAEPGMVDEVAVVPLYRHRAAAPEVARALARFAPDVVQVNLVDPASNLACLTAAVKATATVATLHLQGTPPPKRLPAVSRAIAPSAAIAAQLRGDLRLPVSRVVRIRHGVEIPDSAECAVPDRAPADGQLVVGVVARLTEQKGLDLLLDVTRDLIEDGWRFRVVIAGAGRDKAALRRRAAGLPVRFLGLCHDVPGLLRGVHVFCLPSRREALSLALLEAAAHGLPCVTTAVGDTWEALEGAALIVEPDNRAALAGALRRVLSDPTMRSELGRLARMRAVRDFDVRLMAACTADVLRTAAVSGAARRSGPARG